MERFDVVVVGAGIAGLGAAWSLSEAMRVAVVETEAQPAQHATGRSAAMLNETSGPPEICALASASRSFLETPPAGFTEVPVLAPRGLVWVGVAGSEAALAAVHAKAPDITTPIDTAAARRLAPRLRASAAAAGGVHEPDARAIDVAALLAGYRGGFAARGGSLRLSSEAIRLRRAGGVWEVTAGRHELTAALLVNAAGAWADVLASRAGLRLVGLQPMRRTAALVAAPADVESWPMVMDVDGRWYAEPEAGGLLVSAAGEAPSGPVDARPDEVEVALAVERVNEAFDLDLRHVRRAWAGLRTFAPDRLPVVGPDPDEPSFVWLAGQGGAGIKTAPALSKIVADSIVRGAPWQEALLPARLR